MAALQQIHSKLDFLLKIKKPTVKEVAEQVNGMAKWWTVARNMMSDTNLHTVHKTTHRLLTTSATTPSAEHHMQ